MIVRAFTITFIVISIFCMGESALIVHESFETAHSRPRAAFAGEPQDGKYINQRRSTRYKYREFAETEFHRPGYLPVPYVVGGIQNKNANESNDLRTMPIPNAELSQLIRQHISHQRNKFLRESQTKHRFPATILEGVTHITELRQTPFRRFPESSPANHISYEEKRRRWKADLSRRLRGPKVPARSISTAHNEDYNAAVIINDRQVLPTKTVDSDRYYVTYSPQSHTYQVSRQPPPNFYDVGAAGASLETPIFAEPTFDFLSEKLKNTLLGRHQRD